MGNPVKFRSGTATVIRSTHFARRGSQIASLEGFGLTEPAESRVHGYY